MGFLQHYYIKVSADYSDPPPMHSYAAELPGISVSWKAISEHFAPLQGVPGGVAFSQRSDGRRALRRLVTFGHLPMQPARALAQPGRRSFPTRRFANARQPTSCRAFTLQRNPRELRTETAGTMTSTDSVGPAKAERYREIANSVRALIPSMHNPEVQDQLDVLALEYEKLAHCLEALSESLRTHPLSY
jgi:hypothetical protein